MEKVQTDSTMFMNGSSNGAWKASNQLEQLAAFVYGVEAAFLETIGKREVAWPDLLVDERDAYIETVCKRARIDSDKASQMSLDTDLVLVFHNTQQVFGDAFMDEVYDQESLG